MFTLNCKGKLLALDKPLVMAIINVTPDSFYPGSRFSGIDNILLQVEKMLVEGADIIDIGGQSTRPGSEQASEQEELGRVVPVINAIHQKFPEAILSIDTYNAAVAAQCVCAGASIVNDISAGSFDNNMISVVAQLQTPYVIMHTKGKPANMQQHAKYANVTIEVLDFLAQKKRQCTQAGIHDIIIDPGFGFAKTAAHNFEVLRNLAAFKALESPLLVGLSRKSSIYTSLGVTADEALNGTTVLNTIALMNGAHILRVHDVKPAKEAVLLWSLTHSKASDVGQ